ncbi:Uncharacterised protein [Rothia kristinae]|nr:Uncharacterised protein [Rothia kristinae]
MDVEDKAQRVRAYHAGVMRSARRILASMGLSDFKDLGPEHVMHRIDSTHTQSYEELYDWLEPRSLVEARPRVLDAPLGAGGCGQLRGAPPPPLPQLSPRDPDLRGAVVPGLRRRPTGR